MLSLLEKAAEFRGKGKWVGKGGLLFWRKKKGELCKYQPGCEKKEKNIEEGCQPLEKLRKKERGNQHYGGGGTERDRGKGNLRGKKRKCQILLSTRGGNQTSLRPWSERAYGGKDFFLRQEKKCHHGGGELGRKKEAPCSNRGEAPIPNVGFGGGGFFFRSRGSTMGGGGGGGGVVGGFLSWETPGKRRLTLLHQREFLSYKKKRRAGERKVPSFYLRHRRRVGKYAPQKREKDKGSKEEILFLYAELKGRKAQLHTKPGVKEILGGEEGESFSYRLR